MYWSRGPSEVVSRECEKECVRTVQTVIHQVAKKKSTSNKRKILQRINLASQLCDSCFGGGEASLD